MSVMTFACTVLLGLLPTGIRTIHDAISTTVEARIMQSIVNSAEIEAYPAYPASGVFTNSAGVAPAIYYFDDEGTLLAPTAASYVYMAKVETTSVSLPGTAGKPAQQSMQQDGSASEPGVAALLRVIITSINSPNTATTNTVVWPNSGS